MPYDSSIRQSADRTLAELYTALWDGSNSVPDVFSFLGHHKVASPRVVADVMLIDQFRRQRLGTELPVERYFERFPEVGSNENLKLELIVGEFAHAEE